MEDDVGVVGDADVGPDVGSNVGPDVGHDVGADSGADVGADVGSDIRSDVEVVMGAGDMVAGLGSTLGISILAYQPSAD